MKTIRLVIGRKDGKWFLLRQDRKPFVPNPFISAFAAAESARKMSLRAVLAPELMRRRR